VPAADGGRRAAGPAAHRRLAPAAVLAVSLLCFFALAWLAHPSAPGSLDVRVNDFVAAHRSSALTTFFTGYTGLGRWLVLAAATVVALAARRPGVACPPPRSRLPADRHGRVAAPEPGAQASL